VEGVLLPVPEADCVFAGPRYDCERVGFELPLLIEDMDPGWLYPTTFPLTAELFSRLLDP
jgi:hypothetical protein